MNIVIKEKIRDLEERLRKENLAKIQQEGGWIIAFNEYNRLIKNYAGKIVTNELIDEIIELNNLMHLEQQTGLGGYWKFYFDFYENGEKLYHIRYDIGDGESVNKELEELKLKLQEQQENSMISIIDLRDYLWTTGDLNEELDIRLQQLENKLENRGKIWIRIN